MKLQSFTQTKGGSAPMLEQLITTSGSDDDGLELIVDSFAGGGGASTGIELALGRSPDFAINHDPEALALHAANHPKTVHLSKNIYKVDPIDVVGRHKVGLLWASPDCFPVGTLVMTRAGLVSIEDVEVGEEVLTHRNRWRSVTSKVTREADTVCVRGHGHFGLVTTPTHAFYSKHIVKRYPKAVAPNERRPSMVRTLVENPFWPAAEAMVGKLWATPHTFPPALIPTTPGAALSPEFFYWVGRWLGDGSINKLDVEICVGASELAEVTSIFEDAPLLRADGSQIAMRLVDHGSSWLLVWANSDLSRWLRENFGLYCHGKRLPLWALSMQRDWREALLRGYVDADGYEGSRTTTRSVSKELAIGIRLLAVSLGHAASLYFDPGRPGQIDGREFQGRDAYLVAWTDDNSRETTWRDSVHQFSPVREVVDAGRQTVVSLQVDEDESFVADGIVVHNCKHFSKAKGGKPVKREIRDLAWTVVLWAERVSPRVIILENVEEFQTWGPLVETDKGEMPDPDRRGETFELWIAALRKLGYRVEWRELRACDFGAPTTRKRLFLIARRDRRPIVWPDPTHGAPDDPAVVAGRKLPWRTAAEIIDWREPCPSIFESSADILEKYGIRANRPLAENTMARIAKGVKRYVIDAAKPFIVNLTHGAREESISVPAATITGANRGEKAVVAPHLTKFQSGSVGSGLDAPAPTITANSFVKRPGGAAPVGLVVPHLTSAQQGGSHRGVDEPHRTITASDKDQNQVVAAHLSAYYGPGAGSDDRSSDVSEPIRTVVTENRHAIIGATLVQTGYGERDGQEPRALDPAAPLGTVVAGGVKHAAVAAHLQRQFGASVGHGADEPFATVTAGGGGKSAVVAAFLAQHNAGPRPGAPGHDVAEPVSAVTTSGSQQTVVSAGLMNMKGSDRRMSDVDRPTPTVTATGNHVAEVRAFLMKYYGVDQDPRLEEPLATVTTKDRFGIVMVDGEPYQITDIGMRMLTPRELFRAQGFPEQYRIDLGHLDGQDLVLTKTAQVRMCGNSVCPPIAAALVAANCADMALPASVAAE